MSFLYVPTQLRIPALPHENTLPEYVWCGRGRDARRCVFSPRSTDWGPHVMTEGAFAPSLRLDGREYQPVYSTINGFIWWTDTATRWIYRSLTHGWGCIHGKFAGYEPLEENIRYDEDKGAYTAEGDDFWSFTSPPYGPGTVVTVWGRGSNMGKDDLSLTAFWKRWTCGSECGVYKPQDGAEGERVMGLPRFRSQSYEYFTRSYAKTKGRYTYGRVHYDAGAEKWVIGTVGSDSGWHEGDEPRVDGGATFKFCRNEGSGAEGRDITLSYVGHVRGDERYRAFMGEVAVWR